MRRFFKLILFGAFLLFQTPLLYSQAQAGGFDYKWAQEYAANEFDPMPITFDYTGVRDIEQAPAPYVHPRIFFGPSEIPDLQNRMLNTTSGQAAMNTIHAYTTLQHKGYVAGGYNHNATYGRDAFGNRYIDNAGKWDSHSYYYKLIAEDPTALDGADNKRKTLMCSIMACEAFECMIKAGQTDPDTGLNYDDRAADLATAMAYWASLVLNDPNFNPGTYASFGGLNMAMCYDLNYNNMTTAQQDIVRQAIATMTPSTPLYGGTLTPYATTSNWVGLNTFELIINMSIENETGYQHSLTTEYMRSYRNFLTYGWYESGVPYEGMGKNYQFNAMLIAMAKRGYSLLGHPHMRAYGNQFLANSIQPYGHSFLSTDVWGGSGINNEVGGYKFHPNDIVGLKWAYPNDSNIDFAWRNYIEKWHSINSEGYVYQQMDPTDGAYHAQLLTAAIFAQDYQAGDWQTQFEAVAPDQDFLGPERGVAILRSGHDPDDLMMQYHCRMDLGGHTHGDRNNFTLSGLGRIWTPYSYNNSYQETTYHSCVLVNDLGIAITQRDGKKARQPGILLDFQSNPDYSTVAGDATYAYSWEWHWDPRLPTEDHPWLNNGQGWTEVTETWNDFRYQQGTQPYHDLPFYDYAHWASPGRLERMVKRPYNPMNKVYRTAAMIKGNNPFALIADDVEKDGNTNNYKSLIQLAMDLQMESYTVDTSSACGYNHQMDVIIGETSGTRKMLIRILSNTGMAADPYMETVSHPTNSNVNTQRLVLESNTVTADFKFLLYPYNPGDPMPETIWNDTKDELIVNFGTDSKLIKFPVINGRTNILLDQNSNGDLDSDGVIDFCDVCPLDANNDSDGDGSCDTDDVCPGGDDFLDTNGNNLADDCEAAKVSISVLLEGPFDPATNLMKTILADEEVIPLTHPYGGLPYNHTGSESIASIPANMVDWVLVEARTGTTNATKLETKAGLLLSDGSIVATDGASPLLFDLPMNSDVYFVIRHRNHLDVMTATSSARSLNMSYDFRNNMTMAYGSSQQNMLPNGQVAMIPADVTQDHVIQTTDYDQWESNPAILSVYNVSDVNLDASVQTTDYDLWFQNKAKLGPSELAY